MSLDEKQIFGRNKLLFPTVRPFLETNYFQEIKNRLYSSDFSEPGSCYLEFFIYFNVTNSHSGRNGLISVQNNVFSYKTDLNH